MTFLPIVVRELRVASRKRGTYWVRSGAALAVIIAGTWLFLIMESAPQHMVALTLFGVLTGTAVLYALLSGVRSTADCLSGEKREGTLGLLFLTDLRGYDVVLGKMVANSFNAFYAVLAVVPILALPLLMGGITPGEFGRMALVALNTLFFSLSLGIGISSVSRSAKNSAAMTLLLILFFAAMSPALGAILSGTGRTSRIEPMFLVPSPAFAYYLAFDLNYRAGQPLFWYSLALVHGLAWLALGVASFIAPRSWQEKSTSGKVLGWRDRWRSWTYGDLPERKAFRRRLLDRNAFYWLAARARLKPASVWAVLALLACGWVWGLAKYRHDWLNEPVFVTTALILNGLIRFWFANEAARQLAEERKAGTLELLLSTPLRVSDILHGQYLALVRQFLGPLLLVLAIECVFMFAVVSTALAEERALWFSLWTAGMLMLVADLVALYWLCQWLALTVRNPLRAAGSSLAAILFFPWGAFALVMLGLVLTSMRSRGPDPSWKFFLGLWFGLGIAVDLIFGGWARHNLRTRFRVVAQQRYSAAGGIWKRLFGGAEEGAGPRVP